MTPGDYPGTGSSSNRTIEATDSLDIGIDPGDRTVVVVGACIGWDLVDVVVGSFQNGCERRSLLADLSASALMSGGAASAVRLSAATAAG